MSHTRFAPVYALLLLVGLSGSFAAEPKADPTVFKYTEYNAKGYEASYDDWVVTFTPIVDYAPIVSVKHLNKEIPLAEWTPKVDKVLILGITIHNASKTKKHKCIPWNTYAISTKGGSGITVTDEYDNKYAGQTGFQKKGYTVTLQPRFTGGIIRPLDSVQDYLLFERPVDAAKELTLKVPAIVLVESADLTSRNRDLTVLTVVFPPPPVK